MVCIVAAGLVLVVMAYFDRLTREARETALRMGLGNIRMGVRLYHALNERYPHDIRELFATGYLLPAGKDSVFVARYLEDQTLDHDGYPVDPFGHRYRYDPVGGRVLSESKGYEQW
ncbi:MAG TPA: hypothetical protein VFN94_04880 [Nitrospiria bacterium]|nr:hypothetical protein [Nitrospiria bacterium]